MDGNSSISICIPTYNNSVYLKESLRSLLPQVKPYSIPIYVSDNASTDDTIKILSDFRQLYPHVYFRSNSENLGVDQNIINAVKMASSRYVWPMAARRKFAPDCVKRVHNIITKNNPDLLLIPMDPPIRLSRQVILVKNRRYKSAREVFLEHTVPASALGYGILPLEAFSQEVLRNYHGKYWIILTTIFEHLASSNSVNVVFSGWPSIGAPSKSSATWVANWFQVWNELKNAIRALPTSYSDHDKELVIRKHAQYYLSIHNLVNLRSEHVFNLDVYNQYREDLSNYTNSSLSIAKMISLLPIPNPKPLPIVKRASAKIVRTLVQIKSPTKILRQAGKNREEKNEVAKTMQIFFDKVKHDKRSVILGEKEVRKALQENIVQALVVSERVGQIQVTYKCSACGYEGQYTSNHQKPPILKNFARKRCPRCRKTSLRIIRYQDPIEDLAQLAEQSGTIMIIAFREDKVGRTLLGSLEGIGAILRSSPSDDHTVQNVPLKPG
jgi:abequosyltransferase